VGRPFRKEGGEGEKALEVKFSQRAHHLIKGENTGPHQKDISKLELVVRTILASATIFVHTLQPNNIRIPK
jgi:hypothetical protein